MARKSIKLLLPMGLAFALALTLWTALTFTNQPDGEAAVASSALPADRVDFYNSLLEKSIRQAPYLVAPDEGTVLTMMRAKLGPDASEAELQAAIDEYYAEFHRMNNKESGPNPIAQLGRLKAHEIAEAKRAAGDLSASSALGGNPQVLSVMTNFTGEYTFATGAGGDAVMYQGNCLTDTTVYPDPSTLTINGPSFNEIPSPVGSGDNRLAWLDPDTSYTGGFTEEYYDEFMYGTTGYTGTFRPDLDNPWDGGQGFDFSGVTFRNYYDELSRGAYVPEGDVIKVDIPEAQAFFGANRCGFRVQDDGYFGPSSRVAISAANQINIDFPTFDWTNWDQEDVLDYDNDGNFKEPDGYVDHFFIIYAGLGNHFGATQLEMQIWGHSSDVNPAAIGVEGPPTNSLGGYQVSGDGPMGGVWILNYTVSDEGAGMGILVHEYGHDIGLPDNYAYDTSGPNPGLWDLMASGSWSGELASMRPAHMSIWDKEFLGWNDPLDIDVEAAQAMSYTLGQQSIPPAGTEDGLRINLPSLVTEPPVEPFDTMMWWSTQGHNRSESIAQELTLQAGETVTITAQLAYLIEEDWDYHFWEVSSSVTGGWVALEVYSGTTDLTTDTDPNGNNPNGNAITGHSPDSSWVTARAVITPDMHEGGAVDFRFRYFQDAAAQEEGVFLDNISIDGSLSGKLITDDAEGADTWTHASEGVNTKNPWGISNGVVEASHYYLVEWRNSGEATGPSGTGNTAEAFATAGFDLGLNRTYWIAESFGPGQNLQSHLSLHTPGMLVWYVNNSYGDNDFGGRWFEQNPAYGPKGRVLLVDANPYNYLVADPDPTVGFRELGERRSAFDGAFGLVDRPGLVLESNINSVVTGTLSTDIPGGKAKPNFRDRIGAFTGTDSYFSGVGFDTGVVLPTVNNVQYHSAWTGIATPRTGNPGLNAFGVNLEVVDQGVDGTWGQVRFWMDDDTVFVDKTASASEVQAGETVTYTIYLKDASGTRWADRFNYSYAATMTDTLPDGATMVADSLTLTGGGNVYTDTNDVGEVSVVGNQVVWTGNLGANRLDEADALIEYAVTFDQVGTYSNEASLMVEQQMITDTFRNGGAPFMWPSNSMYTDEAQVEVIEPTSVTLSELNTSRTGTGWSLALVGGLITLLVGATSLYRRRKQ